MKKIFQMLLVACLLVLGTQAAFANSDKEVLQEGADIVSVRSVAVASPLYMQTDEKAPDKAMLTKILYDSSNVVNDYTVVSYDTIVKHLQNDKNLDLTKVNRHVASKQFKDNVKDYADTYVVLTVANNNRVTFFFDVYQAGTNQLLYSYQIAGNSGDGNTVAAYTTMCEQFYKHFDRAKAAQEKAQKKNKK